MEWSGSESRQCLELLSWKMDVEWCGFLFSENPQSPPPISNGDIDWELLANTLGLVEKLPLTPSQVSSSYGPGKLKNIKDKSYENMKVVNFSNQNGWNWKN